ncbi:hypothetical protein OTU49_013232 [Cherax quadricarinatus]|uniref:Rhodanese domain-containing protein n=2 Tax=Cherax quadricarinatus TaxID=27406 RepID=A0AAW0VUT5_CHEQU
MDMVEIEGREREYKLHINQVEVDIKLKDSLISNLSEENKTQRERIEELEGEIHVLEEEARKNERIEELEELVIVVKHKNERIEELEEALRQSVRIATDMELEKRDEEERRKEITEKLNKLERKLESSVQKVRCSHCQTVKERLSELEIRYKNLISQRHRHLMELWELKQEALTSALSEKDAHLALLEVGGVRSSRAAQELETLKKARVKLLDAIKDLGEERVRLSQEYLATEIATEATPTEMSPSQQKVDQES